MNLTLLLDLDDTLLENDILKFLPHYLKALGNHLSDYVAPDRMAKELLAATEAMIANENSEKTLEETFDENFYPAIGVSKDLLSSPLTDFYEHIFPSLRSLTQPNPAAVQLVQHAMHLGYTVVIATNPLFPARAIQHRLEWADLPLSQFPFSLVSSYETFHFTKPKPAFLAECLARLGWPSQPAVMVGNSLTEDLIPAAKLGIPGFLVTSSATPSNLSDLPPLSSQGTLDKVVDWLDEIAPILSIPEYNTPPAILAVLRTTPAVLATFGRFLESDHWNRSLNQGEWCFTEIICHLRDSDREINLPRLNLILNEDNAFVPAVNADAWSESRRYCQESGQESLRLFNAARAQLVKRLLALSPEEWETPANHAIFGPTTLREMAAFIAQHDRTHIHQAYQIYMAVNSPL